MYYSLTDVKNAAWTQNSSHELIDEYTKAGDLRQDIRIVVPADDNEATFLEMWSWWGRRM